MYKYQLKENGLYQQWINNVTKEETEKFMPLHEISDVIVGIYADRIPTDKKDFYRYNALLILIHNEDYFFERFLSVEDSQKWIDRLKEKVPEIRYTTDDLSDAFRAQYYTKIDFSQIEGCANDNELLKYIGVETYQNRLHIWKPEGVDEQIHAKQKDTLRPRTLKVEKMTFWIIFFYNLLFTVFLLPKIPIDDDHFVEATMMLLLGYFVVNFLIPTLFVFWRKFTRWYVPLLFIVANLIGLFTGLTFSYIITDALFNYESVLLLAGCMLVLWFSALITVQLSKRILHFLYKRNL